MYSYNGTTIEEGKPFTIDGYQYPSNWLSIATPEMIVAIGIVISEDTPPTLTVADFVKALDNHLNAAAVAKGYRDIQSAALRAAREGPFHAEGVAFFDWMDSCNAFGYQLLAEVQSGDRVEPTIQEFIDMLPQLILP